jgi:hypothetical protein
MPVTQFEKALAPFIKEKFHYPQYAAMMCDCPLCKGVFSLRVFFKTQTARCEKCGFVGTREEWERRLYY